MKIIDANTGCEVRVGQTFRNVNGQHTLMSVKEGLLSARAQFRTRGGAIIWVPLQVRFTHPGFFAQKVGFIPS